VRLCASPPFDPRRRLACPGALELERGADAAALFGWRFVGVVWRFLDEHMRLELSPTGDRRATDEVIERLTHVHATVAMFHLHFRLGEIYFLKEKQTLLINSVAQFSSQ
jgi:hypothetical protein